MENGPVTVPDLSIDDIGDLLAGAADRPLLPSPTTSPSQLEHALQTAAVLRRQVPHDDELALAGLVHDVGHLLPGVSDAEHAGAGAAAVRRSLGERVAGLVGLHVEAKRYLVSGEPRYEAALAPDSVSSLALQGGPMSEAERVAFAARLLAPDAVVLRRADESGKVDGLDVEGLEVWMAVLRRHRLRSG
jgi:predicted HD phosphohydrolase